MSARVFSAGDVVYTRDGAKCSYVGTAEDKHIVRAFLEYEDGEELGELSVVDAVCAKPPTEVLDAEVAELSKREADLRAEIYELEESKRRATHESKALLAKLKQHDVLKDIDAVIEGRFTHFVSKSYSGVKIVERDEALNDESDRYRRSLRLLSLFGGSNGDLTWQINRYSDGSGSWDFVWPCLSLDEARARALKLCEEHYAAVRSKRDHLNSSFLESAAKLGFPLPDDLSRADREARLQHEQRLLLEAETSLARRRAALDAVLAEFPAEIPATAPESAGAA